MDGSTVLHSLSAPLSNPASSLRRGGFSRLSLLWGALLFLTPLAAQTAAPAAAPPAAETAAPAERKFPDGYVGAETCGTCHEDIAKAFLKNRHSSLEKASMGKLARGWDGRACEACHGPGAKHADSANADDIRNPLKIGPVATDKICLGCHLNTPTHVGRLSGSHARNEVACTACHNIHKTGAESSATILRTREGTNHLCAGCHSDVWASFQRPHAHRLTASAGSSMSCVDCHNPHGSIQQPMMRMANANEPSCFRCHADKRGPFVFEHAVVRMQPCSTCHEPHGSVNPKMLNRQEVMYTCLECHSNILSPAASGTIGGVPPAFHDLRSPRYKNCTICHQKIHGSNANRTLLR
jgi:DmsE family decaheme c-type cytochrome